MELAPVAQLIRFDDFELDEPALELRQAGRPIELQQKPLLVLLQLIRNRHRTVSRDELLRSIWRGVLVSDGSLTTAIYEVRRALGELKGPARRVVTVRGQGYRFAGPVDCVSLDRATHRPAAVPSFIGRESELAEIDAALDQLVQGHGRVVLLHGPPGTGKTSLALHAVQRARERGVETYISRALPARECPPFWFWVQVVRAMLEVRGPSAIQALLLADPRRRDPRLIERTSALDASEAGDGGLDPRERFLLFDGMTAFFRSASQIAPMLLALEDLHLADPESLRFLLHLSRDPRLRRLLIVGTHRDGIELPGTEPSPEHTNQLLLRIGCEAGNRRVRLGDLSPADVRGALTRTHGSAPPDADLDWIMRASGGTPFFVAETLRAGVLPRPSPVDRERSRARAIPDAVRDSLELRIGERSRACRELLEALCVSSWEGAIADLGYLWRHDTGTLLRAIEEARQADLVWTSSDHVRIGFRHGYARELLRTRLTLERRAELAARAKRDEERSTPRVPTSASAG